MQYRLEPEGRESLREAFEWLEGVRVGLGRELLAEIRQALYSIAIMPSAGTPVATTYRKFRTRRFRYAIVYRVVSDDLIVVIDVLQPGRDSPLLLQR